MSIQDKRKIPFMVHSELDDLQLPLAEFRVYCHVVRRAGSLEGGSFWASIPNAAAHIGVDAKTFRRALNGLIEKGLLEKTERSGQTSVITIADVSKWRLRVPLPKSPAPPKIDPSQNSRPTPGNFTGVPLPKTVDKGNPIEGNPIEGIPLKNIVDSGKPELDASAPSTEITKNDNRDIPPKYQPLVDAWNTHCGDLPKVFTLNPKRRRQLDGLIKIANHSNTPPVNLLIAATMDVAADDFWQKRRYGLDNLLAGEKYVGKAERAKYNFTNPKKTQADLIREALERES